MDVFWAEVLLENISICNCHVEKEEGDVFVELSTLGSTGVVPTKLVSTIHTPHVLIVQEDRLRATNRSTGVVLLSSEN